MSGVLHIASQRINSAVAGVTGLAEQRPTENIPTAPLVSRLTGSMQWGELQNLFSDMASGGVPQASTTPVSPHGPAGGYVPNEVASKPIVATSGGSAVGRLKTFLGL